MAVAVASGSRREGFSVETSEGGRITATAVGHDFTLVAYHRELLTIRGLLTISEPGRPGRPVRISPTDPVTHGGTSVFLTAWGVHPEEGRYLGIQVSRDPFAPLFWGGCVLLCLSLPLFTIARVRRQPPRPDGAAAAAAP